MPKKITFYTIALLLSGVSIWFIHETYYFFSHTYEQIVDNYLLKNSNIYKPLIFKKFYFTPKTYQESLFFASIASFLSLALNILYWRYRSYLQSLYQEVFETLGLHLRQAKNLISEFSDKQKIFLGFTLASVLWHQIFMYQNIFVAMDETFSCLFFASQGVFTTISHYPVPNNHIFYNLCSIFWSKFISNQILAIRLTSILAFWLLLWLIFYYFLKKTNFQTALLVLMLAGLGFSQAVFAVQGRGYMLVALCFFVGLWSLQSYIQNQRKSYLGFFVIACVIGFWTIPVFLYAFLSFYAYLLFFVWWKQRKKGVFTDFFKAGILIGIWVYWCYCPVLMYSGFSALAGNENVSPKTYDSAWFFSYILSIALRESVIYIMSLPKYVSFVLFSIFGIILIVVVRKMKNTNFQFLWHFLWISLLVTFAIICVMRAFPFYRVWTYYAVFLVILIGWLAYYFIFSRKEIAYAWLLGANILLAIGGYFQFWREIQDFYDPQAYQNHKNLQKAAKQIMDKNQKIYLSVEAFYIRFWLEYAGKTDLMRENSCRADVAVTEIPETAPLCQEPQKEIWFLKFYSYKEAK